VADPVRFDDYDYLYLSPHLDDAVLSCGGRILQQAERGQRVLVVTVCAGDPPPGPLSEFAQSLHDRWGLPRNAPELRRAEDRAAVARLGAEALHLPVPDCIYRRAEPGGEPLYASEEAIFGPVHPLEWPLSLDLAGLLGDYGLLRAQAMVYVPLGIGSHVDHQLTWRLADDWAGASTRVCYYEDYPYAHDQALVQRWVEGRTWTPELAWLEPAHLERKRQAILEYRSQTSTFWANEAALAAALEQHAASVGQGQGWAERVWYNPPALDKKPR
jgi:LmbE family N-acetylglucosaminyl deacetylase